MDRIHLHIGDHADDCPDDPLAIVLGIKSLTDRILGVGESQQLCGRQIDHYGRGQRILLGAFVTAGLGASRRIEQTAGQRLDAEGLQEPVIDCHRIQIGRPVTRQCGVLDLHDIDFVVTRHGHRAGGRDDIRVALEGQQQRRRQRRHMGIVEVSQDQHILLGETTVEGTRIPRLRRQHGGRDNQSDRDRELHRDQKKPQPRG